VGGVWSVVSPVSIVPPEFVVVVPPLLVVTTVLVLPFIVTTVSVVSPIFEVTTVFVLWAASVVPPMPFLIIVRVSLGSKPGVFRIYKFDIIPFNWVFSTITFHSPVLSSG
jgi:hypothetical protein